MHWEESLTRHSSLAFSSCCAVAALDRLLLNLSLSSARCRQRYKADARKSIPSRGVSPAHEAVRKLSYTREAGPGGSSLGLQNLLLPFSRTQPGKPRLIWGLSMRRS